MTIDNDDLLNSILASLDRIEHIRVDEIPNINLYMDQVTTFMDKRLRSTTRDPDDKIMTKTMINNYAKNDLLPSPDKKKYSKEHIIVLIFIYYFKGLLSINDIQTLLNPLTDQFFEKKDMSMVDIYEEVFRFSKAQIDVIKRDVAERYAMSGEMFKDAPKDSEEFLRMFSFICMLGYDVYVKKLLIEKIVDGLRDKYPSTGKNDKKSDQKRAAAAKSGTKGGAAKAGSSKVVSAKAPVKGTTKSSVGKKPEGIRMTEAAKRVEAAKRAGAVKRTDSTKKNK